MHDLKSTQLLQLRGPRFAVFHAIDGSDPQFLSEHDTLAARGAPEG